MSFPRISEWKVTKKCETLPGQRLVSYQSLCSLSFPSRLSLFLIFLSYIEVSIIINLLNSFFLFVVFKILRADRKERLGWSPTWFWQKTNVEEWGRIKSTTNRGKSLEARRRDKTYRGFACPYVQRGEEHGVFDTLICDNTPQKSQSKSWQLFRKL